jgi:hypothetical protein
LLATPASDGLPLGFGALPPALEWDGGAAADLPPAFECEGGASLPGPELGALGLAGFGGFAELPPAFECDGGAVVELSSEAQSSPPFELPPAFECEGGPPFDVAASSSVEVAWATGIPSAMLASETATAMTSRDDDVLTLIRYPPGYLGARSRSRPGDPAMCGGLVPAATNP